MSDGPLTLHMTHSDVFLQGFGNEAALVFDSTHGAHTDLFHRSSTTSSI